MTIQMLRPALFTMMLALLGLGASATPSQALCILFCGGGTEEPEVPLTGVIHPVYVVGGGFFPDTIYAAEGDQVKFYNLRGSSLRVEGSGSWSDDSWTSSRMYTDDSWSMTVKDGVKLGFRNTLDWGMTGEIKIASVPAAVDFGELIDPNGNIIGKEGTSVGVAEGLGYTLAGVGGLVQDVTKGLGLTDAFGLGNN